MKVLTTGSCGLVRFGLTGYRCRAGHPVTGIDNNMRADFFGPVRRHELDPSAFEELAAE
jgi:CDP-paratose 2-epimerase